MTDPIVNLITFLLAGIAAVTLIDTLGAIASRRLNFKYEYLAVVQLAVYFLMGLLMHTDLPLTLLASLVVGFYDGTVGLQLSQRFKPNSLIPAEEFSSLPKKELLWLMLILSLLLAFIGYVMR